MSNQLMVSHATTTPQKIPSPSATTPGQVVEATSPVPTTQSLPLVILPNVSSLLERFRRIEQIIASVLKEGVDYGKEPGIEKPFLYDAGATALQIAFGLTVEVTPVTLITDWTGEQYGRPFLYAHYRAKAYAQDGTELATAEAACSSLEPAFRYRIAKRQCPACGKETIIPGKAEFGGGFVCLRKAGGCGAKFSSDDPKITGQAIGQTENPDILGEWHNIMTRAQKRARVLAVRIATGANRYFTQDEEVVTTGTPTNSPSSDSVPHPTSQDEWSPPARPDRAAIYPERSSPPPAPSAPPTSDHPRAPDAVITWLKGAIEQVKDGDESPSPNDLKMLANQLAATFPDKDSANLLVSFLLQEFGLDRQTRGFVVALYRWLTTNKAQAMSEAAAIVAMAEGKEES